jgi:hypothetical protein
MATKPRTASWSDPLRPEKLLDQAGGAHKRGGRSQKLSGNPHGQNTHDITERPGQIGAPTAIVFFHVYLSQTRFFT